MTTGHYLGARATAIISSPSKLCVQLMYYNFAEQFVAEQKFSNKELFAMLFRPPFQASSEGGDRQNDNK